MKTSKFFFATALLLATATTQAQEPTNTTSIPNFNHSISFEIGAPNNLPGVNHDRGLKQGSPWGVRTGFGFGFYKNNFYGFFLGGGRVNLLLQHSTRSQLLAGREEKQS